MASKAEKRLTQRNLKLKQTLEKSARQFADPTPSRTVAEGQPVEPKKQVPEQKLSPHRRLMRWDCALEDNEEGIWSWGIKRKCCEDDWDNRVHPFLKEYEKKKWGEIDSEMTGSHKRRKKHIYYTFDKLIDEAYRRLIELGLDDFSPNPLLCFTWSGLIQSIGCTKAISGLFSNSSG